MPAENQQKREEPSRPAMGQIASAQRVERNLRRQFAAGTFYRQAKRLQRAGGAVTLLLALAGPVILFVESDLGPTLGAVAGAWIFASRLLLAPLSDRSKRTGAAAQELFDCDVFGIDWNAGLATRVSEEEIRRASRRAELSSVKDWYPTDVEMSWPESVLTCQRSNAVWARRQHRAYGWLLVGLATVWALVGVVVALFDDATLAIYLAAIALPSLPALLDASDLARSHFQASVRRERLESVVDELLRGDRPAGPPELREIQDQLYVLRRDAPLVPEWFYKLLAPGYEDDMRYAARQHAGNEEALHGVDD